MDNFQTIISAKDAAANVGKPDWVFIDCRFFLNDANRGPQEYQERHIRGAVFADLNGDLSGPVIPGKTGRHPLPDAESLSKTFSRFGIDAQCQVVAYDEAGGFMAAARLWWLLKWAGHDAVAVLDGGFKEWLRLGYPTASGKEQRPARTFIPHFRPEMVADAAQVESIRKDERYALVDCRASDRYRGENETIDPVGGHIPNALNAPFSENLNPSGTFKPAEELDRRLEGITGERPADKKVFYCGSGVTAAHNILVLAHAGKGMSKLYAGSWSDWITNPDRPVAKGNG
jgi:thiosulfate/3-mercaptopyruvate sulfurtransferase